MKIEQPLNDTQRAVVEDMLPIAKWTVRKYITSSKNISGLSYDDLLQEAYLALCGAVMTYHAGQTQFKTYAVTVIRNHLIDYCRRIYQENRNLPTLSLDAPGDDGSPLNLLDTLPHTEAGFEENSLSKISVEQFFSERKAAYTGCARLGIEALELKVMDEYGVTDIAKLYQAKPNLVGAWISKATKKIREELTAAECSALAVENPVVNS